MPSPPSPSPSDASGSSRSSLHAELARIVGPAHAIVDPEVTRSYRTDWTGRWEGRTACVVRPANVDEVAAVVAWCARNGVAVVPQGGNTGLVAGATPMDGEVVLSLRRLARRGEVDELAGQVTVDAGVHLADVSRHVAGTGWEVGVDLAARDSATVGGMVATNAGGIRVLRHGTMRAQVLGVEAVLGDGSIVRRLGGLVKDNTGYDLGGLLCGSEGTLGVVTAARLRLVPEVRERVVALVGCPSVADAVALAAQLRVGVPDLDALELVLAAGMALVGSELGLANPLGTAWPAVLLVECGAVREGADLVTPLAGILADRHVVVAEDPVSRARLWRYREGQTEAIARIGVPHKLDVTVPVAHLVDLVEQATAIAEAAGARAFIFGHVGDGNLHVNLVGPEPDDDTLDEAVLWVVAQLGGSISAEHGVGRAKQRWLHLCRSTAELNAFAAIKRALDPAGILNPGVIVPSTG